MSKRAPKGKPHEEPTIGRPRTEITEKDWKTLESMARDGCTHQEMADYLGIAKRTFYAPHIKDRFQLLTNTAWAKSRWDVRKRQREAALKGHVVSSIWWGKQHLNQSDKANVTGSAAGPMEYAQGAVERIAEALDKLSKLRREGTRQ